MRQSHLGAALACLSLFLGCDEKSRPTEYFSVRADLRKCAAPACGGFWFQALNQKATRCFDGSLQTECYAGDIDFTLTGLDPEQVAQARSRAGAGKLIVKGQLVRGAWPYLEQIALFSAVEAWDAGTDAAPSGAFFLARREPIECVTYPCLNVTGTTLNSSSTRLFAGVDLEPSGATPAQLERAEQALAGTGLVVAAKVTTVEGPAGQADALSASQYYVKLAPARGTCRATGCSGQICSDRDMVTTCEWREEYACYRTARCERQPTGACGWTPTAELQACLDAAN